MRFARALVALGALSLALAGCGSSQKASEGATADTVEMPAEEAMTDVTAMPSDMATGAASDVGDDADPATADATPEANP